MNIIKRIGWFIYRNTIVRIKINFLYVIWFYWLILHCSYNEVINRFHDMSVCKQTYLELGLYALLYYNRGEDQKIDRYCDVVIQNTYGLSNTVDLYNYVKNYNEAHSEEAV